MKTVIIVSKCLSINGKSAEFSFKGNYNGKALEGISLEMLKESPPSVGSEYLIYCQVKPEGQQLLGKILKMKPLPEVE